MDQHKKDRAMTVIFNQLEMIQEMATGVGESELVTDLSIVFANALARYCDHKRVELGTRLDQPAATVDRVRQTPGMAQGAVA